MNSRVLRINGRLCKLKVTDPVPAPERACPHGASSCLPSTTYTKQHLSYEGQLNLLKFRGLHIDDDGEALRALRRFGYYRLSGYWYPWRHREVGHREGIDTPADHFSPGHSMRELIQIYEFDSRLRSLVFEGIERIELTLRVNVAYEMGAKDPWIHLRRKYLNNLADRVRQGQTETNFEILRRRTCELMKQSKENFASHFKARYDGQPPLWIAVETWDLGLLSNFYGLLQMEDQANIISRYGVDNARAFESWLSSLNHVRNICAHHGRLYRRALKPQPNTKYMRSLPLLDHIPEMQTIRKEKLYSALCALIYLHSQVESEQDWRVRLRSYFCTFPLMSSASLADYGFPDDWMSQDIWIQCDAGEPYNHQQENKGT